MNFYNTQKRENKGESVRWCPYAEMSQAFWKLDTWFESTRGLNAKGEGSKGKKTPFVRAERAAKRNYMFLW